MLTADLVDARKKDGELRIRQLDAKGREEAQALAADLLETTRSMVGSRREEVEEAWSSITSATKRFKLAAGLRKLAADACTFEASTDVDPVELRRVLFTRASELRKTAFDRDTAVADAAHALNIEPEVVERAMFADLRSEHILRAAPTLDADSLVEAWELGQAQAILLTAVRVACDVSSGSPGLVRAFLAKLKFQKLLFTAERKDTGFRIIIDGPYSMFDAVTKYGLRLALALPALRSLERWTLVADVRWGKTREALVFHLASSGPAHAAEDELHVSDEVLELANGINATKSGWHARPTTVLLDVPGIGVCIPDLELTRDGASEPVYVEVLGYWSRDAVFRRVELAEQGLGARVVFAVSSRLRVSAEVLGDDIPAALYVYKGKMSPRAVLEHAHALLDSGARITGG